MIEFGSGNLLNAEVDAIINTVNTVGVAGKGLALQFRQAYPDNFKAYASACKRGEVIPGRMFVYDTGRIGQGRYVINFPTKRHWRAGSKLEDVADGLQDLVRVLQELDVDSVAVPPLGCGNGGLRWAEVLPLIEQAAVKIPGIKIVVYPPAGAPDPEEMIIRTKRPGLTPARAAVLAIFDRYLRPDYRLGALEAQKLTYFLQICGQPLRLDFTKGQFGPYAENLHHALQRLDGHFIRGYGDRTQNMKISLSPGVPEEVDQFLEADPETAEVVDRTGRMIEGFETPYGLELLSTVHWAINSTGSTDPDEVGAYVRQWTERKGKLFTVQHITAAIAQLSAHGAGNGSGTRR